MCNTSQTTSHSSPNPFCCGVTLNTVQAAPVLHFSAFNICVLLNSQREVRNYNFRPFLCRLPLLQDLCNSGLLMLSCIPRFPIHANSCWLQQRSARTGRRLKYAPRSSFGAAVPAQEIFFHSDGEVNVGARDTHVQPARVPSRVVQDSQHRCHAGVRDRLLSPSCYPSECEVAREGGGFCAAVSSWLHFLLLFQKGRKTNR